MNTATEFGRWLVETSWQAAVLAVLVLLVQRVFRRRLTPRWRYALWLLVVARLVMPATPPSPASVFNLSGAWNFSGAHFQGLDVATVGAEGRAASMKRPHSGGPFIERALPSDSVKTAVFAIWLAVALALLVRMALGNYRLSSRVARQRPVTRQEVLDVLEDGKQELGVHIPINVVESEHVESPALLGFVRPRLLLPRRMTEHFTREELRLVFLHELAHLKRRDIAVNWAISILHALHWFNPVLWVAFYRMRADRELATDSLVLSDGREGESSRYGETMIKLLECSAGPALAPGVVGILEDRGELKRRMTMIAQTMKGSYGWSALGAALMVVLGVTTLTGATGARAVDIPPGLQAAVQGLNLDFENGQTAWGGGGAGYALTVDEAVKHGGRASGKIQSQAPGGQGFGSYTGTLNPAPVAGRRVRLSGWLRLEDVRGAVALWMRADKGGQPAAFETLQAQNISGTRDWKEYAVEIDIPKGADNINFGALLAGGGTLWADDLKIEIVGDAQVFDAGPAEAALTAWLALIDDGQYAKSYDEASGYFKSAVTGDDWVRSLGMVRRPLGKLVARKLGSALHKMNLPGAPDGEYVVITTDVSFEKKKSGIETCTLVLDEDGAWRAAGYFIQ